ncbi:MAG TPA: SDR family NAD(P)-dependent oxidoreductase [Aromatoleum sp.]|uniref:SDR family NAD(P)-dependent oxidoreductase n=1 Tax=Aromatoleum sp. TaxID=2307007 RepID=UPI002B49E851|nr:SDR family NAD(P)-dependent oxidoreductase [Aromatoleum sp.]HJV27674.1 SDR family NAD(P)-dependent oxidoreductase [Aromatoleum sp.]
MDFANKVAVVTGGASGIGLASAEWFAERGAAVVLLDYNDETGRAAAAALTNAGRDASFIRTDMRDPAQVERAFEAVKARHGRVDALVNAAGVSPVPTPVHEYSLDAWDQAIGINLSGTFYAIRFAVPLMLAAGGGAIVNIASMMGAVAHPGGAGYVASKHGVVGLTKAAALDYGRRGIRVNAVGPGVVKTPMTRMVTDNEQVSQIMTAATPLGRFAEPAEMASLIGFLCSDGASFITGAFYLADGGYIAQ